MPLGWKREEVEKFLRRKCNRGGEGGRRLRHERALDVLFASSNMTTNKHLFGHQENRLQSYSSNQTLLLELNVVES